MPEWEKVVGKYAGECAEILSHLPFLAAVLVLEVKVSDAFPDCIDFVAIQQADIDTPVLVS